jgi:hypothetical protein
LRSFAIQLEVHTFKGQPEHIINSFLQLSNLLQPDAVRQSELFSLYVFPLLDALALINENARRISEEV